VVGIAAAYLVWQQDRFADIRTLIHGISAEGGGWNYKRRRVRWQTVCSSYSTRRDGHSSAFLRTPNPCWQPDFYKYAPPSPSFHAPKRNIRNTPRLSTPTPYQHPHISTNTHVILRTTPLSSIQPPIQPSIHRNNNPPVACAHSLTYASQSGKRHLEAPRQGKLPLQVSSIWL
jgi:hypothetical protein